MLLSRPLSRVDKLTAWQEPLAWTSIFCLSLLLVRHLFYFSFFGYVKTEHFFDADLSSIRGGIPWFNVPTRHGYSTAYLNRGWNIKYAPCVAFRLCLADTMSRTPVRVHARIFRMVDVLTIVRTVYTRYIGTAQCITLLSKRSP